VYLPRPIGVKGKEGIGLRLAIEAGDLGAHFQVGQEFAIVLPQVVRFFDGEDFRRGFCFGHARGGQ
jgi:hypothetical protein